MTNKNKEKYKFPVDIKGELELPEFNLDDNFTVPILKNKISAKVEEVQKIKKKKCQSNKLI